MEITGKIIHKLEAVSGTSQKGNAWKKQEYVLETQDAFPKKVFFDFFGERADQFPLNIGDEITLSFDIESREFNGRWYTSVRGWKAEKATAMSQAAPMGAQDMPSMGGVPTPPADFSSNGDENDDLPF